VVSQPLPRWAPPKSIDARLGFTGSIEVMIDENGNVSSAELRQSVHSLYDDELLAIARRWKYKPAMRDGVPTQYLKIVEIRLQPVFR
jgi:TonB family protein